MKKTLAIFLCALLLCTLALSGCGKTEKTTAKTDDTTTEDQTLSDMDQDALTDGKTLRVLAIGNSFSNNTMEHLYTVATAEGFTDVTLGRLYIGSCSLQMHADNAISNAPAYTYYKTNNGIWDTYQSISILHALQEEEWDIITLQQNSGNSGLPSTYDYCLEQIVDYVNQNKTNPNAKLVWHMTWAYQKDSEHKAFINYDHNQDTMYNAIIDTVQQKILTNDAFTAVIPAGTAVQNARTSSMGDTLTKDGYHLNTMGKVIGSYAWLVTFTGKPLDAISLDSIPGLVLTEENKAIILESVNNALANPYEVTASAYTD